MLVGSDDNFCAVIAAEWGALTGRTVTLDIGALTGSGTAGSAAAAMRATLADFIRCTGVTVTVTADAALDQHLLAEALDSKAPDVAVIDGAALLARLAATGTLAPAPRLVQANLDKLWDSGWRSDETVNGALYASPLDVSAHGLVWYSPRRFKAWGYQVPTSWAQLVTLAGTAARSGHGWCATGADGRQVTDWLSEVMLREAGTQAYDAWTAGAVPFTDATVGAALSTVGSMLGLPTRSVTSSGSPGTSAGSPGTSSGSPGTSSGSAGSGRRDLVDGTCGLALGDQGWAATSPASATNTTIGPDGDLYAFPIPPIAARDGTPLQVDADLVVSFANRPEVQALRYYLSTAHWAGEQYDATGRISANRGLEVTDVDDPISRLVVSLLQAKAAVSRFDAVALMPPAVEAAANTQLGRWAVGATTKDSALAAIAAAWPTG